MMLGHMMRFVCRDEITGEYKPDMGASSEEEVKKAAALAARLTNPSAEVELQRWIIDGHQLSGVVRRRP